MVLASMVLVAACEVWGGPQGTPAAAQAPGVAIFPADFKVPEPQDLPALPGQFIPNAKPDEEIPFPPRVGAPMLGIQGGAPVGGVPAGVGGLAVGGAPVGASPAPGGCGRCSSFCQRCKGCLERWLVSEEPDPLPLGQLLYKHLGAQAGNGIAARMVLYDYDFQRGGAHLTARGQEELARITALAMHNPFPIVIERTLGDHGLADARRFTVVVEISRHAMPLPAERIVVGPPPANGLSGVEAVLIYETMLGQTKSGRGDPPAPFGAVPFSQGGGTGSR